ncbi:hypothetical protein ACFFIF_10595 [Vagococcus entomophilus]|nr:hypothetical protein [Vagococcus entomophilus]
MKKLFAFTLSALAVFTLASTSLSASAAQTTPGQTPTEVDIDFM